MHKIARDQATKKCKRDFNRLKDSIERNLTTKIHHDNKKSYIQSNFYKHHHQQQHSKRNKNHNNSYRNNRNLSPVPSYNTTSPPYCNNSNIKNRNLSPTPSSNTTPTTSAKNLINRTFTPPSTQRTRHVSFLFGRNYVIFSLLQKYLRKA